MLVSHLIVQCFKKMGVRAVFGVGGANIEDLYDALFHLGDGIEVVLADLQRVVGKLPLKAKAIP